MGDMKECGVIMWGRKTGPRKLKRVKRWNGCSKTTGREEVGEPR